MNNNLKIELDVRFDSNDQVYYLGRLKAPVNIDLTNGVTFLIFVSTSGEEELQIALNDKDNAMYSKYTKRNDRLKVSIDGREDQHKQKFYVAKVQYNGYIDCSIPEGAVFIVFNSKPSQEELQIVGNIVQHDKAPHDKLPKEDIKVIYR